MLPLALFAMIATGFDQTGAVHLLGPNGLDTWGAYRFEDLCTPHPQPGYRACYRITVVLPIELTGLPPDLILSDAVQVGGTPDGQFIWACGQWRLEMLAIDETIRGQVSWEAERKLSYAMSSAGVQTVNITVGRRTITFTGTKTTP